MKIMAKKLISVMLALCLVLTSTASALAAGEETYLSELRLIYADSYSEAQQILEDTEFADYEILKEDLNSGSGEIGVWLAYKTTTDIEEAITDISVMQMNGGYNEGNYQEMLRKSYEEYVAMGEVYLTAIEYFAEALDAGSFLAETAYRQLNFYTGLDDYEGELLGDVFYDGYISSTELATMFLEGNSYALRNIRSLLAMGVSYNDDDLHYLEKVGEAAAEMDADPGVFDDEDYDELAAVIAPTITTFRNMFKELSAYEDELNYEDEEFTDEELKYVEYKAMAEMLRAVEYLDGQSLYDFALEFVVDEDDYSSLYPLVAGLNDGQVAMTQVAHYYDVVRYSMSEFPEDTINTELEELEAVYGENPFDIYTGVDRSIYDGTFALTTEAYRADAYTESGLSDALFGDEAALATGLKIACGAVGVGLFTWAIVRSVHASSLNAAAAEAVANNAIGVVQFKMMEAGNALANQTLIFHLNNVPNLTYDQAITSILTKYLGNDPVLADLADWSFVEKLDYLMSEKSLGNVKLDGSESFITYHINSNVDGARNAVSESAQTTAEEATEAAAAANSVGANLITGALYIFGGVMMVYSAVRIGMSVYNYYHPDYDDIPMAMVDMIDTEDGDRYIKYDVVCNAEAEGDGEYAAADLNAFAGERWNALYYTKSYEAGKPLLASFKRSDNNNRAADNHLPVHRFGEVICYDLNRYNFDSDSDTVYLSVKQSDNQKAAVADVPQVVGSMFSFGYLFLSLGAGALVGVFGTLGTQSLLQKKKKAEA